MAERGQISPALEDASALVGVFSNIISPETLNTDVSAWLDSRMATVYVAAFSLIGLSIHVIVNKRHPLAKRHVPVQDGVAASQNRFAQTILQHFAQYGSPAIAAYKIIRLLSITSLVVLAFLTMLSVDKNKKLLRPYLAETAAVTYADILAVLTLIVPVPISRIVSAHVTLVVLALFGVYAFRDIWPSMTFTLHPQDLSEGWLLWAKIGNSAFSAIVVPMLEPYPYIPLDPQDPQEETSTEQTASLLSFITYSFMGPVISAANRVAHLPADQLPPLRDTDATKNLAKAGARYLDPHTEIKKGSNLYWGFVQALRRDWFLSLFTAVLMSIFNLSGSIGTNRLLNYLETGGKDAFVRPWVWLAWMGLSPLLISLSTEACLYYSTQISVKTEALVTALVVEHSLRIRVKAETQPNQAPSPPAAPIQQPVTDAAAVTPVVTEGDVVINDASTMASAVTTTIGSDTAPSKGVENSPNGTKSSHSAEPDKLKAKNNLVGRVNNLVTSDMANISGGREIFRILVAPPITMALAMAFLYIILGWSAFVGLAVMIALMPAPALFSSLMQGTMVKKMKATDERVEAITESLSVIRMIKLFGWESQVKSTVSAKRQTELDVVWSGKKYEYMLDVVNHVLPLVHMIVTYMVFTLVMKKPLSASIIFSAMSAFEMVRMQVYMVTYRLPGLLRAKVSVKRLQEFLNDTEMLDQFTEKKPLAIETASGPQQVVGFKAATFAWSSADAGGTTTPSRQGFRLRIENELLFKENAINLIIGPTGSGKTSLLMALLGEMHFIHSGPESWYNLPRDQGVAYAPQESWVLNASIRENIIFNAPFDETRYKKVIYQCALERDLQLFDAGDATEVGERGLTLSGGQKARITMARAVYSSANILILDDILAALDVHTSRWIVEKCFKGDLIRDRTMLLVTHNVAMANPIAGFVVALGSDGRILSQGTLSDALAKDDKLVDDIDNKPEDEADTATPDGNAPSVGNKNGKLIVQEEVAVGRVGWKAFKLLLGALGGNWPILFWTVYLLGSIGVSIGSVLDLWWLGQWAQQYDLHSDPSEVNVYFYLTFYVMIVVWVVVVFLFYNIVYTFGSLRASRKIHEKLISSLIGSTFRWLDTTPTSRMIARCTQDIQSIDTTVPMFLSVVLDMSFNMLTKLGVVVIFTPIFLVAGVFFGAVGMWLGSRYMRAQLPVKRELSNAKAPVLAMVDSVITGLTSIRAYGAQDKFRQQAFTRINKQTMISRTAWNLNRWIAMRISMITATFATLLGCYLVYGNTSISASNIGFTLVQGLGFSEMILYWIRIINELQTEGNSLERIQAYLGVEQEPEPAEGGQPPAYWPASGDIRVENLSARYSLDGPKVLHDITFQVKAGERIGVVGRTGSGKSSLTLSLLRCIYTEGAVYFDGIPTHSVNLDALRSKITIIPQMPELMSGTLRRNLDMFGEHDDATLNDALRAAGLFSLQTEADENKLSLDSPIASGGNNLSVGQRQIIALARALVRQSKLLILDEATSAIDYETDTIIQTSLRKELNADVTVITIAHRLQTIMDADKIMVLDAGRLVEFDSPRRLLQNQTSFLRALVEESSDKEALYAMVSESKP